MSSQVRRSEQELRRGLGDEERATARGTLGSWSPNRRQVIGLMLTGPLVAACQAQGGPNGSGSGAVPNPDLLVLALNDEPLSLDPAQVTTKDIGKTFVFQAYDRLLDIPVGSSELSPSLATKVPSAGNGLLSKDGMTYTFPIRKGVVFHDGTELTADDIKFSWDRVVTMDLPEGQSERFANVKATRVVDKYTFEVVLKDVDASFLRAVAASMAASVVSSDAVEKHGGVVAGQPNDWMAQHMVGTGPYKFTEWARGDHLSFDIFEDYWDEPAHLPARVLVGVQEQATQLQAKTADIMSVVATRIPKVENIPYVKLNTDLLGLQLDELGFNMKIDPATAPEEDDVPADFFQDRRVRQAFNYAFPYKPYISGVLGGYAGRPNFTLPKGMYGYDPEAPIYQYNPAKAKQLFQEAGWWDRGFTISILSDNTNEVFNGAALAMKDGIERLNPNFHVTVLGVPEATFDKLMAKDPVPAAMWSYTSPPLRSATEYFYDQAYPEGTWGSIAGFSNGYTDPERIAAMIDEASHTLDAERRLEIFSELQHVLYDEAMWILTAQEVAPVAYGEWLKGVVLNPMWPRPYFRWALYDKPSGK